MVCYIVRDGVVGKPVFLEQIGSDAATLRMVCLSGNNSWCNPPHTGTIFVAFSNTRDDKIKGV